MKWTDAFFAQRAGCKPTFRSDEQVQDLYNAVKLGESVSGRPACFSSPGEPYRIYFGQRELCLWSTSRIHAVLALRLASVRSSK